jgi:8-oxo-dGTP pyrophosphatase MutT (NUDIX family)
MRMKINSRITRHQGRVFKIVTENVTLPGGVTADIDILQHPGAAAIVPFKNDHQVILIKQYRHALRDTIWEIPAGTIDGGESAIHCAKRELVEETGFSSDKWEDLGFITPVPGYSDERVHIFMASGLIPAPQNLDEDEILDVHPIDFREAIDMIHRGEIRDAKTISGLLLAHHRRGG